MKLDNDKDRKAYVNLVGNESEVEIDVSVSSKVAPDWILFVCAWDDGFGREYYGYWCYGVERDPKLGWLVYVSEDAEGWPPTADDEAAIAAWRVGEPLSEGWYRFDVGLAKAAWAEGVKRWGCDWYEDGDAERYDVVVQVAALGKIVYG